MIVSTGDSCDAVSSVPDWLQCKVAIENAELEEEK